MAYSQMFLWMLLSSFLSTSRGLDNGLALTPPMGWMTYERFRCIVDCQKYPEECISQDLITRTADLLVSEGYLEAGYEYVGLDDCWLDMNRGPNGGMLADRDRFPMGMRWLADYIHGKRLKFIMYQNFGYQTCEGYPGVMGHEQLDVDIFDEWQIDYLKLDGCYVNTKLFNAGYPAFGAKLNATGRRILYSCSWPAYLEMCHIHPNYDLIAESCNIWRNYDDINDSWKSLVSIMNWFGDNQARFAKFAGPGRWNDPDVLIIGNFGLSEDQARVQMAVWAVMAAPLIMSVDLATIKPDFKKILLNRDIIAVNQDPNGMQGLRVWQKKTCGERMNLEIWNRRLHDGSYALAFVSQRDAGSPYAANFTLDEMKLPRQEYLVQDLYKDEPDRVFRGNIFEVRINPTGVKFFKFIPEGAFESNL